MVTLAVTIYLLSLVVWVGGIVFFSFIAAPSFFKALPPEYSGKAVAAIFPKYYPMGYLAGVLAFASLVVSAAKTGSWPLLKMALVVAMTALTISNSLVTYPKARSLKEEISISESRTDIQHLKREFDRIHRWSVINNGIVLLLGLILIFLTARNLTL